MKFSVQLKQAFTFAISTNLILSPMPAFAKDETGDIAGAALSVLGTAASIYSTISGQNRPPSPQMLMTMDALKQQQTPTADKFFNPQKLSQIPGLNEYLAINGINPNSLLCTTLPTTLTEVNSEVCRTGIKATMRDPFAQDAEVQAYAQQFGAIEKLYKNFSVETNSGGELFGVGCMKNATQILNGFFKSRINELDKLSTNIEALQNQFIEASKTDLNSIQESTALLNGGDSELTNEVKSKNPALFDFGKKFNNPACASMLNKDQFNKLGKGGLNAINTQLQETVSTKSGPMGFSAESYARSHNEVLSDINSLADKLAKQVELNFDKVIVDSSIVSKLGSGLSSSVKLNGALTPDLFSDTQTKFNEKNVELQKLQADIQSELGGRSGNAMALVASTNSAAFEAEIQSIDKNLKNDCLKQQSQLDTVLGKIYDPSASKFANDNASNFLKDKIKQIMQDDSTTLEKKLTELRSLESQQGNRYVLRMENSYEVQEVDSEGKLKTKVVPASSNRTPGVFFSDLIKNCQAQFKANTLNNKMTGSTALSKLRQLHQDYKTLAKTHAQDVKNEIKQRLINCDSSTKANATTQGTCSAESFNTGSSGFCAASALSCSQKMQECSNQVDKIITDIKTDRTARVNNYKALVEKNKKDMVRLFDTALSKYMRDGELLRGAFGAGFNSPTGIQRNVPDGQKHLDLFRNATNGSEDGALLLEDPEKFTEMFKSNIQVLKKSVEDQQNQILGGGLGSSSGLLAQHINDTAKKYSQVANEARDIAKQCITQHDKFVAEFDAQKKQQQADAAKAQSELGQNTNKFCRKYGMAMTNPGPACSGSIEDTFDAIGALPGGADAINELERVCAESDNSETTSGNSVESAIEICMSAGFDVSIKQTTNTPPTTTESAPAAEGTTPKPTTGNTEVDKLCEEFAKKRNCTRENVKLGSDGVPTTISQVNCDDEIVIQYSKQIVTKSGGSITASEEDLPAFCTAGNNSSGIKSFMDSLNQGIQQGASAGAVGF